WQLLDHSKLIDQSIKGLSTLNPWDEISRLMVKLSGKSIATTVSY
ncbi:MAG: hypothetical protein ACI945_000904, partial [Pseudohongiellaceae bacterium]